MSVSTKFQTFSQGILIPKETHDDISYRYKRITKQLNKDFWSSDSDTSHSLYVGSYGRDTEIDISISDIDMLMRLPYSYYQTYTSYYGNGQSALLQAVKESVQKTYKSFIKADGQVVEVSFTDGVKFEILPCFSNSNSDSFTYPDTHDGGSWKVTDPIPEITAIRTANLSWNYNLKRLCRMARVWRDYWSVPIGGLLIDTLAYDFLNDWSYKDRSYTYYDWMVRDFFYYLYLRDENQSYWLAPGSKRYVYREGKFEYKALRCYNISKEAVEHEAAGRSYTASTKWQEIFGSKFKG